MLYTVWFRCICNHSEMLEVCYFKQLKRMTVAFIMKLLIVMTGIEVHPLLNCLIINMKTLLICCSLKSCTLISFTRQKDLIMLELLWLLHMVCWYQILRRSNLYRSWRLVLSLNSGHHFPTWLFILLKRTKRIQVRVDYAIFACLELLIDWYSICR